MYVSTVTNFVVEGKEEGGEVVGEEWEGREKKGRRMVRGNKRGRSHNGIGMELERKGNEGKAQFMA